MTEHSGTMVHWIIDGKDAGFGYFQRWAIPVPGDQVRMFSSEAEIDDEIDDQRVEILFRTFEQPESDLPRIWLHARTIAA